jgi:hypothetical protein
MKRVFVRSNYAIILSTIKWENTEIEDNDTEMYSVSVPLLWPFKGLLKELSMLANNEYISVHYLTGNNSFSILSS